MNIQVLMEAMEVRRLLAVEYTLTPLGDLPDDFFNVNSTAFAVSADGRTVVGVGHSGNGAEAFRWTAGGGMRALGDLPGGNFNSVATGVTADGTIIVGSGHSDQGTRAFRWTAAGGMQRLSALTGGDFQGAAISADGGTIAGAVDGVAFRWTAGGGMQGLGPLPGGVDFGGPSSVSADGGIIVGRALNSAGVPEAFRWTAVGGMQRMGDLGAFTFSIATGVSADGGTVVGRRSIAFESEAFRWTASGGMQALGGTLRSTQALGVSADGRTIVGEGRPGSGPAIAFRWTADGGMESLNGLIDAPGWNLITAYAVSAGGHIVGWGGNPAGQVEAFLLTPGGEDREQPALLHLEGNFERIGGKWVATGAVLIGMKPAQGQPFQPLARVQGTVSYDETTISAGGTVFSQLNDLNTPIFEGSFEIPIGSAATSVLVDRDLPSDIDLGGMDLDLIGMSFGQSAISVRPKLNLPPDLGGITLDFGGNKITFDANGASVTDVGVPFPDLDISLFGVADAELRDMALSYTRATETFTIQGKLAIEIPGRGKFTADLTDDNKLTIHNGQLDLIGEATFEDIVIVPNLFKIKELKFKYNSVTDTFSADGSVQVKNGNLIGGGIEFVDGDVKRVSLSAGNLNIALGGGFFLQGIAGGFDNLNTESPAIMGQLEVSYGPSVTLALPDWAGGAVQGKLASLKGTATFNATELKLEGELLIVGTDDDATHLAKGTGTFHNVFGQFAKYDVNLNIMKGLYVSTTKLYFDPLEKIEGVGTASLGIPSFVPIIGGNTLASATLAIKIDFDGDFANDYVAAWEAFNLVVTTAVLGFQVNLDGSWRIIGGEQLPPVVPAPGPGIGPAGAGDGVFVVAGTRPMALFSADWQTNRQGVLVELTAPDGTVHSSLAPLPPGVAVVPDQSSPTRTVFAVRNPAAGQWRIGVPDAEGLGAVGFAALGGSHAPTIELLSPNGTVGGPLAPINYTAADPDSDASISLYWDTDDEGFDGALIADGVTEQDGAGSFSWDSSPLHAGTFHVYARIDDGVNAPVFAYAPGVLVIPEKPQVTAAAFNRQTGHEIALAFDRDVTTLLAAADFRVIDLSTGQPAAITVSLTGDQAVIRPAAGVLADGSWRLLVRPNAVRDPAGHATPEGFTFDFTVLAGDADADGRITPGDYFAIDRGRAMRLTSFSGGDFNYSGGSADADDYMLIDRAFLAQFSTGGGALAPAPPTAFATVPVTGDDEDDSDPLDDASAAVLE